MEWSVDYHIIDRCNLNCAHCSHFSSLVPNTDKGKSLEQIKADLWLLKRFEKDLDRLSLLGGEPTLHPHLSKILRIARELFPDKWIVLTSNGTTADQILRWKDAIEENDIDLAITIYPAIKEPYENFEKIRKVIPNVKCWDFPIRCGMTYNLLSENGDVASDEEIYGCYKRWVCNQLKNGKLYICHYAAYLDDLKAAFPGQIKIDDDEQAYLDLNNDNLTIEDIMRFQKEAYPSICKHCLDVHFGAYNGPTEPWRTTKHDINEYYQK